MSESAQGHRLPLHFRVNTTSATVRRRYCKQAWAGGWKRRAWTSLAASTPSYAAACTNNTLDETFQPTEDQTQRSGGANERPKTEPGFVLLRLAALRSAHALT